MSFTGWIKKPACRPLCQEPCPAHPQSVAGKARNRHEYWALVQGKFPSKKIIYKDKISRDRHDRRKRLVDPRKGLYAEIMTSAQAVDRLPWSNQLKTDRPSDSGPIWLTTDTLSDRRPTLSSATQRGGLCPRPSADSRIPYAGKSPLKHSSDSFKKY